MNWTSKANHHWGQFFLAPAQGARRQGPQDGRRGHAQEVGRIGLRRGDAAMMVYLELV